MSSSEVCNCTTEENINAVNKELNSIEFGKEKEIKVCLIEFELSKSALNLNVPIETLSNSYQSNTTEVTFENDLSKSFIDSNEDKDYLTTCSCSNKGSLKSCDCTTKSLKICTCSDICSEKSEISIDSLVPKILEHTLAIIKPECMTYNTEIEREIIDEGFKIVQRRWLKLTPEQVSDFYQDNYKEKYFAHLIVCMSSVPILVFELARYNAVKEWKLLMGSKMIERSSKYSLDSIKGKYGRIRNNLKNAVHGSENRKAAKREINFFFPDCIKQPMMSQENAIKYLKKHVNKTLSDGLIMCCKQKSDDPITLLGNWLLENNPNKPKYFLHYKSNLYD